MLPPPPPADALQFVHISSVTAALAKLNVKIPIEDLIKAIHDEEMSQRRDALSKLALQPPKATAGLEFTTVSTFVPKPAKPANVDPLAKERRRRLLELTKESFPDGKVPDPFTLTRLGLSQVVAKQARFASS